MCMISWLFLSYSRRPRKFQRSFPCFTVSPPRSVESSTPGLSRKGNTGTNSSCAEGLRITAQARAGAELYQWAAFV